MTACFFFPFKNFLRFWILLLGGVLRLASFVMAILFTEYDHIKYLLYCIIQSMRGHVWAIYECVVSNVFILEM